MNVDYDLFEGERSTGSVRHTLCRGELVYDRGEILTQPGHGRFVPRSLGARPASPRERGGRRRPGPRGPARAGRRCTGGPDGARRVCWTDEWVACARVPALAARRVAGRGLGRRRRQPLGGARGAATADGFVIVGSHIGLGAGRRLARRRARNLQRRGGAAGAGRRRAAGGRTAARRLGRRGGRALRPQPVRLLGLRGHARGRRRPRPARPRRRAPRGRGRRPTASSSTGRRVGMRALRGACAYLELHIEQGPVLESHGEPAAHRARHIRRRAPRRGASPARPRTPARRRCTMRRDSLRRRGAARRSRSREIGLRHGGVCTVGGATSEPGVITAVAGRDRDAARPAPPRCRRARGDARRGAATPAHAPRRTAAARSSCSTSGRIPPIPFDDRLIGLAREAVARCGRQGHGDPERAAARRRRDGAPDPDGDDLLLLVAAGLAHEGGGHPRGGPARGDRGLRAHGRGQRSQLRRGGRAARRASERARRSSSPTSRREPLLRGAARAACASTCSAADLPRLPFTTKEELREGQRARRRPSAPHLCAPRERLVRDARDLGHDRRAGRRRLHPRATTRPTARSAARRSGSRACGPDDVIAHCLNYALYAGGIADHMALEASGATVVPIGTGQSRRLLELIPRLGITGIFGTLSFPAYLAGRAREHGARAARSSACATSSPPASRARAWPPFAAEIERRGAPRVSDTFGMSDVWSTMARRVRRGRGHAPDRRRPRGARAGRPRQRRAGRARGRRERRARLDAPAPRGLAPAPLPLGRPRARVDIAMRLRARLAADPHRRPPRRHAARAGGERVSAGDRRARSPATRGSAATAWWPTATRSCRRCEVYVEAPPEVDLDALSAELAATLRARFAVTRLEPGSLPVAEHKTRIVHRTARGDTLPTRVESLRKRDRR